MSRELRQHGEQWAVYETVSDAEAAISPMLPSEEAVVGWLMGKGYSEKASRVFVKIKWSPSGLSVGGKFYAAIECCEVMPQETR